MSRYATLEQAVSYVAFRTAGHDTEIRLLSIAGAVTHVVLIPSDGRKMTLY